MSFRSQEDSVQSGEVVELYRFNTATGIVLLTSSGQPILFNTELYQPSAISRSRISSEGQTEATQELEVEVPIGNEIAARYIEKVPAQEDRLTIFRGHANDSGVTISADGTVNLPATAVITFFSGIVASTSFTGASAKLRIISRNDILDRGIPKRTYRNLCNHVLYDSHCQVDPAAGFEFPVEVTAIGPRTVTVEGVPALGAPAGPDTVDAPFFDGGILLQQITGDARMVQTLVRNNGTSTIQVPFPFESLAVGEELLLRAGCDHTIATCRAKFDNARRYGGFPTVPTRNPFTKGVG